MGKKRWQNYSHWYYIKYDSSNNAVQVGEIIATGTARKVRDAIQFACKDISLQWEAYNKENHI